MSNFYQYRGSEDIDGDYGVQRTGYVSPGFPASVIDSYDTDFYGESKKGHYNEQAKRRPTQDRKRALNRLQELKPLVDRIINDCRVESKEVKSGLQALREYQTDVLQELKDIVDDDEDYRDYGYDPESVEETAALRQEKIHLMNELNDKMREDNKLAQNYRALEGDYQSLKNQFNRLKKGNRYEDWSSQGDNIPVRGFREEKTRTRTTDQVRSRSRSRQVEEPKPKYKERGGQYKSGTRESRGEGLEAENARLKEQLARAYKEIDRLTDANQELERRLRSADQEISRLQKDGRGLRSPTHKGSNELMSQLQQLKRQNEELRVETIRLLKLKSTQGGDAGELKDQISRLQGIIDKQNDLKGQFLGDIEKYKKKFATIEQENRQLRSKVKQLSGNTGGGYGSYGTETSDYFSPKIDRLYNEMNNMIGDVGKFSNRDVLNEIGTNYQSYY